MVNVTVVSADRLIVKSDKVVSVTVISAEMVNVTVISAGMLNLTLVSNVH